MTFEIGSKELLFGISKERPKIIFEEPTLQFAIGQWLKILPTVMVTNFFGVERRKNLDYKSLRKSKKISKSELTLVSMVFEMLLKKIGIENKEICVLNNFDEEKFTFDCNLIKSKEKISIFIRQEDYFEFGPELTITTDKYEKTYDYSKNYNNKNMTLILRYYTLKNNDNNNTCFRYLGDHSTCFKLKNGDLELSINVYAPYDYILTESPEGKFRLKNEEQFEEYLLNLSAPIDILSVYNMFRKTCLDEWIKYPSIEIKVEESDDKKLVDLLSLKRGELSNFILTRNEKTISFNRYGEWYYESERVCLDSYDKLNINFNSISKVESECCEVTASREELEEINREVEAVPWEVNKVKFLVKKMINS